MTYFTSDPSKSKKEVAKKPSSIFVHPEGLHVLFELLHTTQDVDLQRQILRNIEKLLNPENMEILWTTSNWLEWVLDFVQTFEANSTSRVFSQLHTIIQKMMIFDISKRTSQVSKVKEMVESEAFQIEIIEDVLDYFEKNHFSQPLPTEHATDIVVNLVSLFKYVEEIDCPPKSKKKIFFLKLKFIFFFFFFFSFQKNYQLY